MNKEYVKRFIVTMNRRGVSFRDIVSLLEAINASNNRQDPFACNETMFYNEQR